MSKQSNIKAQLRRIGADFKFWGRSEAKELEHILFDDEVILHALNGRYSGGLALLCATDRRLLLLDKKPLFLTFEDMQYEMISEVDYTEQTICAQVTLMTPAKALAFKSYKIKKLRKLTQFIQQRVSRVRADHEVFFEQKDEHSPSQRELSKDGYHQSFTNDVYARLGSIAAQAGIDDTAQKTPMYGARQSAMYPINPYRHAAMFRPKRRIQKFTTLPPRYQS